MSKYKVEHSYGSTGTSRSFLRDRNTHKNVFHSIEEAHQAVLSYKEHVFRVPSVEKRPLLYSVPRLRILEIVPPVEVKRYKLTPEGPVLPDD